MSSTTTTQLNVKVTTPDGGMVVKTYNDVDHSRLSSIVSRWSGMTVTMDTVTTVTTISDTVDLTPCPYDHSHTRNWCGHMQCRVG